MKGWCTARVYFIIACLLFSTTGIQTTQDARFYGITSKLETPFSNVGKDLVLQFAVRHPQKIDCGGGYIKLLPADVDQVNSFCLLLSLREHSTVTKYLLNCLIWFGLCLFTGSL